MTQAIRPALRRTLKAAAFLLLTLGICLIAYLLFFNPHRDTVASYEPSAPLEETLTKSRATDDLDAMMGYLADRHPACIYGVPSEVKLEYERQIQMLPEYATVLELWRAASSILSRMGDAHTGAYHISKESLALPVGFTMTQDSLLIAYGEEGPYRVLALNGRPVSDLYSDFVSHFSCEQESYARYSFARRLPRESYLSFLGIDASQGVEITCETKNGAQGRVFTLGQQEQTVQDEDFVSYRIDMARSLGVLTLRSCTYNDEYTKTLRDFFTEVVSSGIRNVAVDLRSNGGGNSMVANEFLRYVNADSYYAFGRVDIRFGPFIKTYKKHKTINKEYEGLTFDGNLYVLTSTATFSSALDFAVMIKDNGLGRVVGETPGGMPSSYGDVLSFRLPNSGLIVGISYKYFGRIDEEKSGQPLEPDYPAGAQDAYAALLGAIAAQKQ